MLGEDFLNAANAGDLEALSGQIGGRLPAAADAAAAASRSSGGSAAASGESGGRGNTYILLDRAQFVRAMQEDSSGWFEDQSRVFQRKNA